MAHCQKLLIKEKASEVFVLENPQASVTNALEFLKKMTVIAVSSITFVRKLFPEDAFADKQLEGQPVKILRGHDSIPETKTMIQWLKYAFSLVKKQHLQKLIFVIQEAKSNGERTGQTVETYVFNYDYDEEEICYQLFSEGSQQKMSLSNSLPKDISTSVAQLLRSINVMTSTLKPLPCNGYEFSLRLELNENAPDDYEQSELFQAIDSYDISFPSEITKWKLGKVPTKFTTLTVSAKSIFMQVFDLDGGNDEQETREEYVEDSQAECRPFTLSLSSASQLTISSADDVASHGSDSMVVLSGSSELSLRMSTLSCSLQGKTISCICECDDDKFNDSIRCLGCSTYQHKCCYGVRPNHKVDTHICINCHNSENGKICSDPELVTNPNRKADALYRRALMLCLNETHMSSKKIMTLLKVSRPKAQNIFNKLNFDGCFFLTSGRYGKSIDTDHVKNVINRYFTKVSSKNTEANHAAIVNEKKRHLQEDKESGCEEMTPTSQNKRQKILKSSLL